MTAEEAAPVGGTCCRGDVEVWCATCTPHPPPPAPALLTVADLARRWRTTPQGIYSARHRGECPPALRIGRRVLWRLRDVEVWEATRLNDGEDR